MARFLRALPADQIPKSLRAERDEIIALTSLAKVSRSSVCVEIAFFFSLFSSLIAFIFFFHVFCRFTLVVKSLVMQLLYFTQRKPKDDRSNHRSSASRPLERSAERRNAQAQRLLARTIERPRANSLGC